MGCFIISHSTTTILGIAVIPSNTYLAHELVQVLAAPAKQVLHRSHLVLSPVHQDHSPEETEHWTRIIRKKYKICNLVCKSVPPSQPPII